MLNVHKNGPAIGCLADASYFSALGRNQETTKPCIAQGLTNEAGLLGRLRVHLVANGNLPAVAHLAGNGSKQHAVALVGHRAIVGLNPADTGLVAKPEAIG